ncbi:MAG TPA: carbohydrate porin [Candidatus Binataceae bacterium]|nr:carbohydrate porin [Candidatus Binataceae bacterium]
MLFLALSWWPFAMPARAGDPPATTAPSSIAPIAQSTPSVGLLSWMETSADTEIAGNPGAVNGKPGIGLLGRALGLDPDSIFLGGVWVGNADYLFGGGADPKSWNLNSLAIVATDVNLEKLIGFPGGELGAEFLQFDGQDANKAAGVVTGYDGLPGPPPLNRSELYELWWRQRLFDDKLAIRFGKVVPTYDFDNVIRPIPVHDEHYSIPAVTGVTYTPIFVNPTILGAMPGYYNSAYGITTSFTPTKHLYLMYGVYDGTLATGRQTGISATPRFSGYYFQIGEVGTTWSIGPDHLLGNIGLGGWGQTGQLTAGSGASAIHQNGTGGFYAFGSQRLWFRHPGADNSGVTSFFQFGINNSTTMIASKYFGTGLTTFGLVPDRPDDSIGVGSAWSWLNRLPGSGFRSNELILQTYYQMHVFGGIFAQPTFSYVPNPGAATALHGATALTLQTTVLF